MPQLQSLLSFISLYAENKNVCTHFNELQNLIRIIPTLSETSPSKHWWCCWSTAYRNVNFNVFTSLFKRLKKDRAWYCWDFGKASLKDLDRLMTSSKHPSPSGPMIPDRGDKFGSPHCVHVFSSTFLIHVECGSGSLTHLSQLSLLRFQKRELQVSEIWAG